MVSGPGADGNFAVESSLVSLNVCACLESGCGWTLFGQSDAGACTLFIGFRDLAPATPLRGPEAVRASLGRSFVPEYNARLR